MSILRMAACLVALMLAAGACSADSPTVSEPDAVEPPASPASADPDVDDDPGPDDTEPEDAAPTATVEATAADDGCPPDDSPAVTEDPWLDLEAASTDPGFALIAEAVRSRTAHMTEPSSDTCTGFVVVDRGVVAADFGAVAVRTYEHADPYVRFDIFVYESKAARQAADAFTAVEQGLPALLPPDYQYVLVSGLAESVVIARSHEIGDNGFPPNEVGWIADDYGQRIAGFE